MAIKIINTYVAAGYALNGAKYTGLEITSSGAVAGNGVSATTNATIQNYGGIGGFGFNASYGVTLTATGTVTNAPSGSISGIFGGVSIDGPAATVANYGYIFAVHGVGVALHGGGTVINGSPTDTTARIGSDGIDAVRGAGGPTTVTNFGTIFMSKFDNGVELGAGGSLTNGSALDTTASIDGYALGVGVFISAATITNFGSIIAGQGPHDTALDLGAGGIVINGSAADRTARIDGSYGVYASGAATVTSFGTIDGNTFGAAVTFKSWRDELVVEPGSAFNGAVLGGSGTLALAGGTGTLTGLFASAGVTVSGSMPAAAFQDFSIVEVRSGASFTDADPTTAIGAHQRLADHGSLTMSGAITNSGEISLGGGQLVVASGGLSLTGAGYLALSDSGANQITGATAASTLTVGQIVEGAGKLGAGQMTLAVQAKGVVYSFGSNALVIDTGAATIANAGIIEAVGAGGTTIASAVANSGRLIAWASMLTVDGAVSGAGYGEVHDGTLKFAASSTFNQNVVFDTGSIGTLELSHGQTYSGVISGLSATGTNGLSLDDVGFIAGTTTASWSKATGTLTVTDGSHTAAIKLAGDYGGTTFTTSAGSGGVGTRIVDTRPIHWASQVSGGFATTGDWTGGVAPGAANDAILDAAGAYTVTSAANEAVASIQTAPRAFLNITGGVFTAVNGTGIGVAASNIVVRNGATLDVGGGFANDAAVTLYGGGELMVAAGGATLTGTGYVALSDNAANLVTGATAASTLTVGQILEGSGRLGAGKMTLDVLATGVIYAFGANPLVIDTGAATITNAGVISAAGTGGLTIAGAVVNDRRLAAWTSMLTVEGAVTGSGYGQVHDGTLKFAASSTFNQDVVFDAGSTGTLELAHSINGAYSRKIHGLSTTGANALWLDDISFIDTKTTTAKFSGTTTSGVLTVTDGTHTAKINLVGDYLGHTFTTSAGVGGVGTRIVDPPAASLSAAPTRLAPHHPFIAAMATLGAETGGSMSWTGDSRRLARPMLVMPRMQAA